MALMQCNFFSDVLGVMAKMMVIIPQQTTRCIGVSDKADAGAAGFRTLYLLHGLSDDETVWERRTSIERYAQEKGIAVVMPTTLRFFYTDTAHGYRYFTHIADEVPALAQQFFRLSPRREDNYVAGLSMGGYGAFKVALSRPERFAAAASMSGVMDVADFNRESVDAATRRELEGVFGPGPIRGTANDLYHLAEQAAKGPHRPRLFQTCGTEDFLYKMNVAYRDFVKPLGFDYTYTEMPGVHCWEFWDARIQEVLAWLG